jgi:4-alpha-glucanotransferase
MLRDEKAERAARRADRVSLWRAFSAANPLAGDLPAPDETSRVVDEAVSFIAATPCPLALLPLEDALGQETQPNVPGTLDEHPNWKRRYAGDAGTLLEPRDVRHRLETLAKRGAS